MPAKPFRLAVKAVVFDDANRCLLLRRSAANKNFVGCWEWPGGKVDSGEDFATAALRETAEEAGLQIELTGLAGVTSFEMPAASIVLLCMEARVVCALAVATWRCAKRSTSRFSRRRRYLWPSSITSRFRRMRSGGILPTRGSPPAAQSSGMRGGEHSCWASFVSSAHPRFGTQ